MCRNLFLLCIYLTGFFKIKKNVYSSSINLGLVNIFFSAMIVIQVFFCSSKIQISGKQNIDDKISKTINDGEKTSATKRDDLKLSISKEKKEVNSNCIIQWNKVKDYCCYPGLGVRLV